MPRTAAPILAAAILALALTGCDPDGPPTPSSSASASESAASSPSSSPTPTEAAGPALANLPSDCAAIGSADTRAATVDGLTLQGDGTGFVRPAPASAQLVLGCDWFTGDATGVLLLINRVDADEAAAFAATLPSQGFNCTTGDAGNPVCQKTTPNSQFPVDTVETILSREDVWIYMSTSNVEGDPLLSDLNASIWPPA